MVLSENIMSYNFTSGSSSMVGGLPPPPLPFFHTSAIAAAHVSGRPLDNVGGSYQESASAAASASASASASGAAASSSATASLQYLTPFPHNYPTEADTLAYVDALKHSDLSEWRSLQEVANRAGGGSCSGAVTTSVLTALYLLGLFNLCAASPASCCVPSISHNRKRCRRSASSTPRPDALPLPRALNRLPAELEFLTSHNLEDLPHITTPEGGRVPVHISVVEKVRKLWDSNPRLLSSVMCKSPTESVRSSFISLSGVAAGIILAYSVAQLSQCYPDHAQPDQAPGGSQPDIFFFPIPSQSDSPPQIRVPSIPAVIPVPGEDDPPDGCARDEVPLGIGRCAPLLSTAHCPTRHWVLLNHHTRMGECVPQLCPEGRIYVEADQLCHDVNEPGLCPGEQRLFMTAAGYAVCDCPDGMFQDHYGNCYLLYDQAYCDRELVLQFHKPSGALHCDKDPCGVVNSRLWEGDLPYAPRGDGYCYQFGKQGPCKGGELFGYNIKALEATCVSLVDAGLVRSRRSFMYHRMSFPSTQDHTFPHYQVSYVIMNGTTWGLQLKSLHRSRREVHTPSEEKDNPGDEILFLDTREIPTLLKNMPGLRPPPPPPPPKSPQTWPLHRRHHQHHRQMSLQPLRRSPLFRTRRKADDSERRKKVKKLVDAMISMRRNESISTSGSRSERDSSSNNSSTVSVSSNNTNITSFSSISSNSSSSSSSSDGTGMSSNSGGKNDEEISSNSSENSTTGNDGDGKEENSKKSSGGRKKVGKKDKEEKLVKVEQKATSRQKDRQVDLHRDNKVLAVEQQKVLPPETPVVVKQPPSSHSRRRSRKHRKDSRRNRKRGRKGGRRRGRKGNRRRGGGGRGGKKGRLGKGRNRSRNRNATTPASTSTTKVRPSSTKTADTNASRPTLSSANSTSPSTSVGQNTSTTSSEPKRSGKRRRKGRRQKGRKNPKLPFRVPTVFPPSEDTGTSDGSAAPSSVSTTLPTTKPSSPPTDGGIEDSNSISSSKSTSSTATTPEVVDQGHQKPTSSSEATLPEYLRHRDRRQLGSGGGIIDAPLLVKCRPGAERDYNNKCREVFVPADRDRRAAGANTNKTPSQPSIECPQGTRLDPQGKCKTGAADLFG